MLSEVSLDQNESELLCGLSCCYRVGTPPFTLWIPVTLPPSTHQWNSFTRSYVDVGKLR